MAMSSNVTRLVEISAPLWAGEAEVVRTYWDSPVRTPENGSVPTTSRSSSMYVEMVTGSQSLCGVRAP